ncbi:hypothetical protein ACFYNO_29555 [Kitasatospora sp. NPDC006697]|uniref:hypothetical protein n=1 Tax=Kitasatospora sp. NPDC006697 TaxID=3364020 RepID=UPI00369629CA
MPATLTVSRLASVSSLVDRVSVQDRRRPGQRLPKTAVGGVELNRLQVATALFEAQDRLPQNPTHLDLIATVGRVLETHGVAELDGWAREMLQLTAEASGQLDVAVAWSRAHSLMVSQWYTNATSRLMSQDERAVALYLAGDEVLARRRQDDYRAAPLSAEQVSEAIALGASRVSVEELVFAAAEFAREQHLMVPKPSTAWERERRERMKRLMPDWQRRRFVHFVAERHRFRFDLATPLVVETSGGARFYGVSVEDCPEMGAHFDTVFHGQRVQQQLAEAA